MGPSSSPLPPEVERFFQQKQNEQRSLNNIAVVQKNLRETTTNMHSVIEHIVDRGVTIDTAQCDTRVLMDSSSEFLQQSTEKNHTLLYSVCAACVCWPCNNIWWCRNTAGTTQQRATIIKKIAGRRIKTFLK
jgi:Synaptobrevin